MSWGLSSRKNNVIIVFSIDLFSIFQVISFCALILTFQETAFVLSFGFSKWFPSVPSLDFPSDFLEIPSVQTFWFSKWFLFVQSFWFFKWFPSVQIFGFSRWFPSLPPSGFSMWFLSVPTSGLLLFHAKVARKRLLGQRCSEKYQCAGHAGHTRYDDESHDRIALETAIIVEKDGRTTLTVHDIRTAARLILRDGQDAFLTWLCWRWTLLCTPPTGIVSTWTTFAGRIKK